MSLNVLTAGDGPPMLLLHGFTGVARSWSAQIEAWSADYRIIAPDLLGHGGSDAPADPAEYALERQAKMLAELLELLEAVPATVVGYSMGARLGLVLALEQPQAVARLVLESPTAGIAEPQARAERRKGDEDLADGIERDGIEAFVEWWEGLPLFDTQKTVPTEIRERQRAERLGQTATGLAASLRGAGQGAMSPQHDRLAHVTVPTLILAGELDPRGLASAREVAAGIAGSRLEVFPDAGHTPHLESAEAFTRVTNVFLSENPITA
jgi:2-succinyl-6-hydroxy-2,4-cyclohexadiene-1-carboxylate synthase